MLDSDGIPSAPRAIGWSRPRTSAGPIGPVGRARDLGHLRPIVEQGALDAYLAWALEQRRDFVVWPGPKPHVVVIEPESALRVFANDELFVRNAEPTRHLFGRGLLRREGDAWADLRRTLAPAFRTEALAPAVPVVQRLTDELIERWASEGEVRPTRDLSFLMLQVLGEVLFGYSFDAEKHGGKPLHRALITLSTDSVMRHFLPPTLVSLRSGRDVRASRRWLDALCADILDDGGDVPLLDAIRASLGRRAMDRETAIDNIRNLLIAGHETSATAVAWSTSLLAQYPELADEVAAESEAAESAATIADVGALEQANRWSKETMRLFPPVPISISQTAADTTLGHLQIPRGTRVDFLSYVLHRLPWLWPDPTRFDPSRFATKPEKGTFLPYLVGSHTCLGMRLADVEVALVTARLAGALRFTLPDGPPKVNLRLSLNPGGLRVCVARRGGARVVA